MKKLAILGASGHGKVVADTALATGWCDVDFYDDRWPELDSIGPWSVHGTTNELLVRLKDYDGIMIAIGDNRIRLEKANYLQSHGALFPVICHPSAIVSSFAHILEGTLVVAAAVVNVGARIGRHCIINTSSSINHDCLLGDAVHISPGAHLAGTVSVGDRSWIGIGACIVQERRIGTDVIVAAGAIVISDVENNHSVAGVPAKLMRKKEGICA